MNFRQIEAFRAVMIGGTATTAAQMLFISQPAVSRLIRGLEDSVGFDLFERRRKRLVPTVEGKQLYAAVEQTFVGLEHVSKAADAIRTASVGTLRIASTPLIAHGVLCRLVSDFLRMFPDIYVELAHGSREFVIERLASQVFDIGIEATPINNPAVREEVLIRQNALCVLRKDHPLGKKRSLGAEDLDRCDFIAPELGSMFRYAVDQAFKATHISPRIRVETTTQTAICSLAARGVGIGIVAPYVVPSTAGMPLIFRRFKPEIPVSYSIPFPAHRSSSLLTDKFHAFLRTHLTESATDTSSSFLTTETGTSAF